MARAGAGWSLVDVGGRIPDLYLYRFLSAGGAGTMTGFFVDERGIRAGISFTAGVDPAAASTFADLYGQAIPTSAVGFVGTSSVPLHVDISDEDPATDFEPNKTNYPQVPAGTSLRFGRVGVN